MNNLMAFALTLAQTREMNTYLCTFFSTHDDRDASAKSTLQLFQCIEDFEYARQGESKMNKAGFAKLAASVKQAGKIRRGAIKASRVFNLKPVGDRAIHSDLRSLHQSSIGYTSSVSTVD